MSAAVRALVPMRSKTFLLVTALVAHRREFAEQRMHRSFDAALPFEVVVGRLADPLDELFRELRMARDGAEHVETAKRFETL